MLHCMLQYSIAPHMEWRLPESEEPSGQGPCSASHSLYRVLDPGLVLFKSPNVVTDRSSYGDMPSNADAALLGKLGYQAKKTGVYRYIYVYIYIYIYIHTHTHTMEYYSAMRKGRKSCYL